MRLLRCMSLLVFGLSFFSHARSAQAGPTPSCSSDPVCAQLANQARERSGMGLLEDAQRYYASAYEMTNDPKLLYERGRVLHKLGRFADAASCYRKFLDTDTSGNEKQRRKVEQYLDQAQAEARDAPPTPPAPTPPPTSTLIVPPTVTPPPRVTSPAPFETPTTTAPTPQPTAPAVKPVAPVPVAAIRRPPPPPKAPMKVYKQWWFWTAIGVGVAGIAVGTGLGIASRGPDLTGSVEYRPFGN